MAKHITKALVQNIKTPSRDQVCIWDDQLKGFGVRITNNGFRSFVFQTRIKGRLRRITLKPEYPILSVAQARHKATELKAAIGRGEDPIEEKRRERAEPIFGDIADAYLKDAELRGLKARARSKQRLDAHTAKWRTRRLSDVSRDDVAKLHDQIAEARGQVIANRTVTLIRTVFNHAADRGLFTGENPAGRIKLFHEQPRRRFLSAEELGRVNKALADEPSEYWRAYFALTLLLGTRKTELLAARWADVDLKARTLRLPSTKSGQPHLLPLPQPAAAILEALPSRGSSEWVFPGGGKSGHLVEPRKAWERIREAAKVMDVTIHDLRRTLGSWLAANGCSLLLIGKALNHQSQRSTEIYSQLNLDPVREALERNARLMLDGGEDSNGAG
jgi:integrase